MAYIGSSVEYALHCLLWIAPPLDELPSSRDLAELQGVPVAFLAKIFPKLQKAGIVVGSEGIRGGYRLARAPDQITILDVVEAVEGNKPLFDCQEVRGRCALFGGNPPAWSTDGICGIHAAMIRAEKAMRRELAQTTLAVLAAGANGRAPANFPNDVQNWFTARATSRSTAQLAALRQRSQNKPTEE